MSLYYNYNRNNIILKGYYNTNQRNNLSKRKLALVYLFSLSPGIGINNPVLQTSQLYKVVTISSYKAKYIAFREATKEAIYLVSIFDYINNNL